MDIDPIELVEQSQPAEPQRKSAWLNSAVAITVALLATFMGICKVKDDNIVQAMQQAQADKLDHWQYYQARNIREEVAKSTLVQLRVQKALVGAKAPAALEQEIANYEALAKSQSEKKEELRKQADQDQASYDALNFRDDQFDLSDAALAVASLTQMVWLYALALVPSAFGIVMGVSGLTGGGLHPDALVRLLT